MQYVGVSKTDPNDVFVRDAPVPLEHYMRSKYTIVRVDSALSIEAAIAKAKEVVAKSNKRNETQLYG